MANRIKHKLAYRLSKELCVPCTSTCFKTVSTKNQDLLSLCWSLQDEDISKKIVDMSEVLKETNGIASVTVEPSRKYYKVNFNIDSHYLMKTAIKECIAPYKHPEVDTKKILIEFSSPNMAKPFHVGHMRSTIIGNALANLHINADNKVTKMNYLGDWGTQCGFLKVGVDLCKVTEEKLRNNPNETLFKAYVRANDLASTNDEIKLLAKQKFNDLENGDPDMVKEWNLYKSSTLDELIGTYDRIGVKFDVHDCESMYNSKICKHIMDDLEMKNIIETDKHGLKFIQINDDKVALMKSDGSSLYLSRDVVAAHDRYTRYNFDEMLYIVDNTQDKHFRHLFHIFEKMDSPIANKCKFVPFGRIHGMSTRKGNVIFLKDILNEARDKMQTVRLTSKNTKGSIQNLNISDTLAISGVIVHDLMHKRNRDYVFQWDTALQFNGNTGVKLQYTHCRLYSIENNCGIDLPTECVPKFIQEPECAFLIHHLSKFSDVLQNSLNLMEPYYLVDYLFTLTNSTNNLVPKLIVKNKPEEIAQQRLLLFHSARLVLKRGMEILGLKVLNEM